MNAPAIFDRHAVPGLTTVQMIEVDRAMIQDFGIELIQMMENAGRNLADLARSRFLGGDPRGKRVTVLAGSGGNGGGALVAARRLDNWGAAVGVALAQPAAAMTAVPAHQLSILERIGIPIVAVESITSLAAADVVLDGLIGYSLKVRQEVLLPSSLSGLTVRTHRCWHSMSHRASMPRPESSSILQFARRPR